MSKNKKVYNNLTKAELEKMILENIWDAISDYLPGSSAKKMKRLVNKTKDSPYEVPEPINYEPMRGTDIPEPIDFGGQPPPIPAGSAQEDEDFEALSSLNSNLRQNRAKLALSIKKQIEDYFKVASSNLKGNDRAMKMVSDLEKSVVQNTLKALIKDMNSIKSIADLKESKKVKLKVNKSSK